MRADAMCRHRFLLLCLSLTFAASVASELHGANPDPRAKFDVFWTQKPAADGATIALFQFDEKADATGAIDDLEETIRKGPANSDPLASTGPVVKESLIGDAKLVKEGRFGGGVAIAGKGGVRIVGGDLPKALDNEAAITIDFWINPAANQPSTQAQGATILVIGPVNAAARLHVERSANGVMSARLGDAALLTHRRAVPADHWTHVSLTLRREATGGAAQTVTLGVDGDSQSASTGDPSSRPVSIQTLAAGPLTIGCSPEATGGFIGGLDVIRLSRGPRGFYRMSPADFADPEAKRTIVNAPPYFVRERPPLLHAGFDKSLESKPFAGVNTAGTTRDGDFVPGVRGRAISLARAKEMAIAYAGKAVMPMERGSIEFWLQPLAWNNFFVGDTHGTNIPHLQLMHFAPLGSGPDQAARTISLSLGRAGFVAEQPFFPIHPGQWTHVVCAWGPSGRAVYLNGEPQPMAQFGIGGNPKAIEAYKAWLEKSKGGDDGAWALQFTPSATAIDELFVYDRQFNAVEARNAYVRYLPEAPSRLQKLEVITPSYSFFHYGPRATVTATCLPVNGVDPASVRISALGVDGKPIIAESTVPLNADGVGAVTAEVMLDFASYPVVIESLAADGRVLAKAESKWTREKPVWWQNTLGTDRVVPRPWTPIKTDAAGKVEVWGRKIEIDARGLPSRVSSANADVLEAPARVILTVDGKETPLVGDAVKFGETAADVVSWRGSTAAAAGVRAVVSGSVEFDGLMRFEVTLSPDAAPAKLERLRIEFPMPAAHASQLIVNGGSSDFRGSYDVRMIPQGTGRVWDSRTSKPTMKKGVAVGHFCPLVWIGDDERGLCFFGENDNGWTPANDEASQEIHRDGDTVVYRMNVITKPVTLEGPRNFTFYVQPTPVKPLPSDWRTMNRGAPGDKLSTIDGVDDFSGFPLTETFGGATASLTFALEPRSWDDAAKFAAEMRAKFGKQNPVYKYIDASWPKLGESMKDYRGELWTAGRLLYTREVEDYYVWIVNEYLKRGTIDGIYVDDVSFGSNRVTYGTAYKLPDGTLQPGFNTLGLRRMFKRLWVLCDQAGKRPHFTAHMTWCFEIPALSFFEAALNGEDRVIPPNAENTFIEHWGVEEMRVMSSSEKFGVVMLWIPEIKTEGMENTLRAWSWRQGRAMHALAVPHDQWYMFGNAALDLIRPPMVAFGIGAPDTRFIPYWKIDSVMRVGSEGKPAGRAEGVLTSAYARKNKALVIVGNLNKTDREITVTVAPGKLFGENVKNVAWRDVDPALEPPVSLAASKNEIAEAQKKLMKGQNELRDPSAVGGLDGFSLEDEKEKARDAYRIEAKGITATLRVRARDYRLIEIIADEMR